MKAKNEVVVFWVGFVKRSYGSVFGKICKEQEEIHETEEHLALIEGKVKHR